MVSEKLIELWKAKGNLQKLREHGILIEPTPEPIQEPNPVIEQSKQSHSNRPVSFRPTTENLLFLKQQSDKTQTINKALEFWRNQND